MVKRNFAFVAGSIGMSALLVAGLRLNSWSESKQTLLARATRITDAPRIGSEQFNDPDSRSAHFFWLSDHELLCLRSEYDRDEAYRVETRTGKKTAVPNLTKSFAAVVPNGEAHLSPDRKWLLWTGVRHPQTLAPHYGKRYVLPQPGNHLDDFRVVVTALDGTTQTERQQGGNLAWLPDSQGWVRLLWNGKSPQLAEQRLASPQTALHTVADVEEVTLKDEQGRTFGSRGLLDILGVDARNRLLVAAPHPTASPRSVFVYAMALRQAGQASQVQTVALPGDIDGVALSPEGNRLAWKVLERGAGQAPAIGLWVSDLNGNHPRKVGDVAAPRQGGWNQSLYNLGWTPDGNHLSFAYQGAFWTVPIPLSQL